MIAVEKCRPTANITCANETEVDRYFETHPIKLKTGYLKFGRDVFADIDNYYDYVDKNYSPEYVPISTGFRDWSTSFLNSARYKRNDFVMMDEVAFDKTNMQWNDHPVRFSMFD